MIMFALKLYKSIKAAIAGRKHPRQLAAGVAFGVLLGIVPHGNLLALAILLCVLTLRLNHAIAGLTAIGVTFVATRLDPFSHEVGNYILANPRWSDSLASAWQVPLVPWTDLNNTVVMGSFVIGLIGLIPIFMLTYPVFKLFAGAAALEAKTEAESESSSDATRESNFTSHPEQAVAPVAETQAVTEPASTPTTETEPPRHKRSASRHSIVLVDQGTSGANRPHMDGPAGLTETVVQVSGPSESSGTAGQSQSTEHSGTSIHPSGSVSGNDISTDEPPATIRMRVDESNAKSAETNSDAISRFEQDKHVSVETRIDVIRMRDYKDQRAQNNEVLEAAPPATQPVANTAPSSPPTDEALNYLLRQLRDSQQQRKAG